MADTTESTTTNTAAPEKSPATTSMSDIKPPEIKRSWGDEAEENPDDSYDGTDGDSSSSKLPVDQLSIKDRKDLDEPEDSNIQTVTTEGTPYTSAKQFEDLNLTEELLKGLYVEMRFERPSKIQAISLPMILTPPYKNLIAQAHNGSGKTTCFVLGMLSRVDPKLQAPQALCICPTRELAIQNLEVLQKMGKYKVMCPDELAKVRVIRDKILELGQKVGQTIIFVRTRHSAGYLHKSLVDLGYEVTTIQGALNNDDRDKIVKEFKEGLTKVLISTDVLARGFDQSQVNLVVNYDLPVKHDNRTEPDYEVYMHRVGRAGRFGRKGAVFNLLCDQRDILVMEKIEEYFGSKASEVKSYENEEDFESALKDAGLL